MVWELCMWCWFAFHRPENWPQSEVKSLEEKKEKEKEIDSMDEDIAENEEEEEEDEFLDMGYNPNRRARTYSEWGNDICNCLFKEQNKNKKLL